MNQDVKEKLISVEDMQSSLRETYNAGIGNEGVCSTAADTAAKTVTLGTTFSLTAKATIIVTFTHGITVDNATLAVTHTTLAGTTVTEDAKAIYLNGAPLEANNVDAGVTLILRYDGTNFNIIGGVGSGGADAAVFDGYNATGGAPDFDAFLDTVHVTAQTLTAAQKAQARENIGVVGSGFHVSYDTTTGLKTVTALGTATAAHNTETGITALTF